MEWPSILKIPDYNPPKSLIMRARLKRKVSYIWTGDQFWRLGHMEEKVEEDILEFSSVQFSRSVLSNSLRPHGLQHARLPCSSPTPRAYSNSCPSSRWCHLTISSSVVPFSSCLQPFPASGSFPVSRLFTSSGQLLSCVLLFATSWTVACQAPLSMGFSRQEHWSGLQHPSLGHLPNPGIQLGPPVLQAEILGSVFFP